MTTDLPRLRREISRRRTFAICSHPDAGKTTLTEKLLLYGGALQMAGAVKARRAAVHATSDWMEIERKRGISTTTSVMSFEYGEHLLNLLDTPGHADFSEDTYRTLAAVDAAVLLIDAAKGVEAQTEKLFRVCADRGIPIFVFFNKLDRFGRAPLELLDDVEEALGIRVTVVNWPVGMGPEFQGVYDRRRRSFHVYEETEHGSRRGRVRVGSLEDPAFVRLVGEDLHGRLADELDLLDGAGEPFDVERIRSGELAPAFFGSALTNFGVDLLLEALIELAPPPGPGRCLDGGVVPPDDERFTGIVFKIQANMNPQHRDRLAFLRIVSGRFETGLGVTLQPRGRKARLTEARQVLARQRTAVEEAFPGDVVGLFDPGTFRVGDTVTVDPGIAYPGIPFFPPELFAIARVRDTAHRKAFQKGLDQLAEEGAIQVFRDPERLDRDPILAAVGQLQLDVFSYRLEGEYRAPVQLQPQPFVAARWISGEGADSPDLRNGVGWTLVLDRDDRPVLLLKNTYWIDELRKRFPDVVFSATSGAVTT
jgi:peptide chain release factor 3